MPAWDDRLKPAAYTGPDGTRLEFIYEDLSKQIRKKTFAHEFPDVDATYVEDKGLKGQVYQIRAIISGDDHDIDADAFEALLDQRGPGVLEHPRYGRRDVIPFGDIRRQDAVKTEGNQTTFDIAFWETALAVYPSVVRQSVAVVDAAVEQFASVSAAQFDASVDLSSPAEQQTFGETFRALKDGAVKTLSAARDASSDIARAMDRVDRAISAAIDLGNSPEILGLQLHRLMMLPSRSASLIGQRLFSYGTIRDDVVAGRGANNGAGTGSGSNGDGIVDPGDRAPGSQATISNRFQANKLLAEQSVAAMALAVSGEEYRTRGQALEAALELATSFQTTMEWVDSNYSVLFDTSSGPDITRPAATGPGALDPGDARDALHTAVTTALQYLLATSFTLDIERTVTNDRPRTVLDLAYELYGHVDSYEEFVVANEFTGDEILELPVGREVKYYG
jgi:hypothetical protein